LSFSSRNCILSPLLLEKKKKKKKEKKSDIFSFARPMKVKKKMMKKTKKPFSSWSLTKKPLVAKRKKVLRVVVVLPLHAFKKNGEKLEKNSILSPLSFVFYPRE